jgi:uncharacterized BrkB/YihY/UPF0761 family membrane protein
MSFSDLPKYPGEAQDEREKLLKVLKPDPAHATPDTWRQRLQHLFPNLILLGLLGFALFLAVGMIIIIGTQAVDAGLAAPLAALAAALGLPAVAIAGALYERNRRRDRH